MMATSPVQDSAGHDGVTAVLKYVLATGEMPVRYKGQTPEGEQERTGKYAPAQVHIRNGRSAEESFSLDRNGFVLRPHATRVADFYDEAEVRAVYYPEVARFIEGETGAARVVVFDHTATRRASAIWLTSAVPRSAFITTTPYRQDPNACVTCFRRKKRNDCCGAASR
jgi:hypothetical protein